MNFRELCGHTAGSEMNVSLDLIYRNIIGVCVKEETVFMRQRSSKRMNLKDDPYSNGIKKKLRATESPISLAL